MPVWLLRWRADIAHVVAVDPVLAARIERQHQLDHLVADPGAGAAELPLAAAIAAGERHEPLGTRAPFGFKIPEGGAEVGFGLKRDDEAVGVFERDGSTLAGVR